MLEKVLGIAKGLVEVAKILASLNPKKLLTWWESGFPIDKLKRTRRVLYVSTGIGAVVVISLTGVFVVTAYRLKEQLANSARLATSNQQLHGEYLTLNASYHLNASDYCTILQQGRQSADHSTLAIKHADHAIAVLSAVSHDSGLSPWQQLQLLNHLGLSHCIKGVLLADQEGSRDREQAMIALSKSADYYKSLQLLREGLTPAEVSEIASLLPEMLSQVQWYQALGTSVRARLSTDAAIRGDALERVRELKKLYQNICPVEENRRLQWVLENCK